MGTLEIPGVILAGGRSSRMGGGDKCLLRVGGVRMLDHVIGRLAPQVDEIVLNANGDAARFADFNLPVIADSIDGFAGPLAGVLAGLDWAAERGFAKILTVAADTPFFPGDLVTRLQQAVGPGKAAMALAATQDAEEKQSLHPTFGLWSVTLRDDLRNALGRGQRKMMLWTDRADCATVIFEETAHDSFFNINTLTDKETAEAMREMTGQ